MVTREDTPRSPMPWARSCISDSLAVVSRTIAIGVQTRVSWKSVLTEWSPPIALTWTTTQAQLPTFRPLPMMSDMGIIPSPSAIPAGSILMPLGS